MRLRILAALCLLVSGATAYLISNSRVGSQFVFEAVPDDRLPADILVDTDAVPGVANPRGVVQELMDQWNAAPDARDTFGTALVGGPYNGQTVGSTFGRFTDTQHEVAFDDVGDIFTFFGVSPTVLGITLKSVTRSSGALRDFLVVINTRPGALTAPGATADELFRATCLHELGHTMGLGHSAVGLANTTTFGLRRLQPNQIATMFPFRLPQTPELGASLEADDYAALTTVYPDTGAAGLGSISGRIVSLSGAPGNEVQVRAAGPDGAIDEHVAVLSNADSSNQGRYTIENLQPGAYRVLIEAINGRASIGSGALASGTDALGGDPLVFAPDEFWQVGETYDPAVDDKNIASLVQVRAGRDSGFVDFLLNAAPILQGQALEGVLNNSDQRVPSPVSSHAYADYYVFQGAVGQDVTLSVVTNGFTPHLRLLRPSDLDTEATHLPVIGSQATIATALEQSGIYTFIVTARLPPSAGAGTYTVTLQGAGGGLPGVSPVVPASAARGPADPGAQQFGSPVLSRAMLQVRVRTPSHEALFLDQVTVRASGSGHDVADIENVRLVHDLNGNGRTDGGEPVLAQGTFPQDNGTLIFGALDWQFAPNSPVDLLVVYDVRVQSVSSTTSGMSGMSGASAPLALWGLPMLLLLVVVRPRRLPLLLLLVLLPLSCGGGGGGQAAFNPDGAIVTFEARMEAGDVVASTTTSDPTPVPLLTSTVTSGTLQVSN